MRANDVERRLLKTRLFSSVFSSVFSSKMVSLAPGVSAAELSREVRRCLNDPDLMFRRFRYKDESGKWRRKWKKRYIDADGKLRFEDCDRVSYRDAWTGMGYIVLK